jgi:hypothetical protein
MNVDDLRAVFPADAWNTAQADIPGADASLTSKDVAVFIIEAANGRDAAERWPQVQTNIDTFRQAQSPTPDCYLVIVVPELTDMEFALLRPAMDDTLICRKVIVPLNGRGIQDAFREDFPLIAPIAILQPYAQGIDSGEGDPSEEELEWMAKTGIEVLVDQLVERLRKAAKP